MSHSWIGIEGLPILMWNFHVFKVIGDACGGFLEIAEETNNKTFLGYAKIKVKGFENGFMNPVIEILCEGEQVCLGAFAIRGEEGSPKEYRTAGITTRAVTRGILPNQPCSETKRPWMGRELHFQRVRKEPMKWKMMTWTGL